jgi:HipA-like protein
MDSHSQPHGEPSRPEGPAGHNPILALEVIRRMRGASQPYLMRCADESNYVVKFQNNPQHVRILANEMLAGRLAMLIGLPVAAPAFVEVPPGLIRGTPPLELEIGSRRELCLAGLQFGSRYPGAPGQTLVVDFLPDRLLSRVKGLASLFLGGFVFDKWTCNCDGRQVVFYHSVNDEDPAYSALLIDQGFCFNDGDWSFPDSPIRGLYPRRLVYDEVRGLKSFEPFLSRVENLDSSQIGECISQMPGEWCGPDPGKLNQLAETLYKRRRGIRQAIIDAKNSSLKPFPNWRETNVIARPRPDPWSKRVN